MALSIFGINRWVTICSVVKSEHIFSEGRLFCVNVTGMRVLVKKRSNLLELVLIFIW